MMLGNSLFPLREIYPYFFALALKEIFHERGV
ncbi:hypothetical protein ACUXCC_004442 [Cytobacillus horneckiae]